MATTNETQPTVTIQYNGSTIANLFGGQTATLKCGGMKMESDVTMQVAEQTGGSTGSATVYFVTFIGADGSTLWEMPVLAGDDCKDPITHGDISTPTKESTVQYNYTYSGWALTEGGTANSDALKEVNEDKTVYAAFTSSIRTYTVNFYDGETLITTQQVAYGGSSTYEYEKLGYTFEGWNPEPTNVISDMDCYAILEEAGFYTDSWETIVAAANDGTASARYAVGDTKELELTYADGTTETILVEIADFNRDVLYEDSTTTAGMTLIAKNVLKTTKGYQDDVTYNGYTAPLAGGYPETTICEYVTGTVLPAFPEVLQAGLKNVSKICSYGKSTTSKGTRTEGFKVWIPSIKEVNGTIGYNNTSNGGTVYDPENDPNNCYSIFSGTTSAEVSPKRRRGLYTDAEGTYRDYWLRSVRYVQSGIDYCDSAMEVIESTGLSNYKFIDTKSAYICIGFCI